MFKLVVLFSVLALAAAKPGYLAYSAVPAYSSVSQYSADVVHGSPVVPAVYSAYNAPYYGAVPAVVPGVALSQAPHSPAVVLDAVNGVPLDTPEVVAARAAHYQAKALAGVHHLAKRSVAPVAYSAVSPVVAGAVVSPFSRSVVSPLGYSSPFVSTYGVPAYGVPSYGYSSLYPRAVSVHPW
ncbi:uncharacterized protein [Epargyreus clarus]|uniref:uncharacterized protein n=1 Tax=Epargyreus clarus TaxID=520877 RepID=UPI003C2C6B90